MSIEERPEQVRVAKKIAKYFQNGTDVVILEAPTGSGKSALAFFVHQFMKEQNAESRSIILSHQLILQDQYEQFLDNKHSVISVKGKSNYECYVAPTIPVDKAPCQFTNKCVFKHKCEYYQRRKLMLTTPLVLTNYHLVYSLIDIERWESSFDLVVYDECHNVADLFTDYRALWIDETLLERIHKMRESLATKKVKVDDETLVDQLEDLENCVVEFNPQKYDESFTNVFQMISAVKETAILTFAEDTIDTMIKKDKRFAETVLHFINDLKDLGIKWTNYLKARVGTKYIFETSQEPDKFRHKLTPITVQALFPSVAKEVGTKYIFMSAFVGNNPKDFLKTLGLQDCQYKFVSLPSAFPIENRKISFSPIEHLNNSKIYGKKYDLSHYYDTIISICKLHAQEDESGVIFTPSYVFTKMLINKIQSALKDDFIFITNKNASERDEAIKSFRETSYGKRLLISPSFYEGVNFEDSISRFQILTKAPFMAINTPYVKVKAKLDPEWYGLSALKKIVQASGRSIRNPADHSATYILDGHCLRLYMEYEYVVPQYFKDAVEII